MPKIVCKKCEVELGTKENGVYLVELCQRNTRVYKIWSADLWKCRFCGLEVVSGFADNPTFSNWNKSEEELRYYIEGLKLKGRTIIYDKEVFGGSKRDSTKK